MMKEEHRIFSLLFIFIYIATFAGAQTVSVNLADRRQVIRGFGAVNMPGWMDDLTIDQLDMAFGNAPGQVDLNILRIRVPDDTAAFNPEVPAAIRAKSHGAMIIASPWTPPPYMKTNRNMIGGHLDPAYYNDYASYLLNFAGYMASNGVPLYAISVQNEPDYLAGHESCEWTSGEIISFLKSQGQRFDTLRLIVAESRNFDKELTDPILHDSETAELIDITGGHLYGSNPSDYPLARTKGKEVWMTEHHDTSVSWTGALATGKEINDCMLANFNAYIWWYIRGAGGLIDEDGNITKRGYVVSQFSRFIHPGFVRVGTETGSLPDVYVSAFRKDSEVVILIVNMNTRPVSIEFTAFNGAIKRLNKFTTSVSKNMVMDGSMEISCGIFTILVDAESVTTLSAMN